MIAILKKGATAQEITSLTDWLSRMGLQTHLTPGNGVTILGLIGDVSRVDAELLSSLEIVESVQRISEPFKQAATNVGISANSWKM